MKKNWVKKALGIGLAITVSVGLCACGGGSAGVGTSGSKTGGGNANSALAKENVYRVQEIELPQIVDSENGYMDLGGTALLDGRLYMLLRVEDWSTDETKVSLLSMKEDGTDVENIWLSLPGEDSDDHTDGEDPTEDDKSADEGEAEVVDGVDEDYGSTWDYTAYSQFTMTDDGSIYGIRYQAHEDYSDPDNYVSEQHDYVCCWNREGEFLWEVELEDLRNIDEGEEWLYIGKIFPGEDGSLNVLLTGDNAYLLSVSADGVVSGRQAFADDVSQVLNNYQYILPREDGSLTIVYMDADDWTKTYVTDYDLDTGVLGERGELPASLAWNGFDSINIGAGDTLVYSNSTGVYSYTSGDADVSMMMNYINSDVNITSISALCPIDENSFIALYYENYENDLKAGLFTYVAPEEIADRTVIVLAGNYIDSDMVQRVVEFNRSNENYRIVTKDYSQYNTYDDYTAGTTQLNNDIITGGMPDILLADSLIPVENYIAKGLIADINPLIEADEELSQTEFMQNVFDAFSVDGKLCYIVPSFYVNTYVAKASLVGDGSDWSMEKMQAIVDSLGEDAQAFGEMTRDNFMSTALQYCGNDFIDIETGKCRFDSDDFIAMMGFAETLPEEIDWDSKYSDDSYWDNYDSQYRENRTLLLEMTIGSMTNLTYYLNGYLGEDFTFVGFPTEEGCGSHITPNNAMVLSAKSDCLEGAWEFVRYYLTDEYQGSLGWGLPVSKKYFDQQAEQGTKRPTYTDYETGEEVEYDESFWMNGEEIVLDPLTEEQMNKVVAFVESVDTPYYSDDDVLNIINEELGSFYTGQKSAKDTAAIIQNRVQLYVEENR